jgi:hypothetical protein
VDDARHQHSHQNQQEAGSSHSSDGWLPSFSRRVVPKIATIIIKTFRDRAPKGLFGGHLQNGRRVAGFAAASRIAPHKPSPAATPIRRRPMIMGAVWQTFPVKVSPGATLSAPSLKVTAYRSVRITWHGGSGVWSLCLERVMLNVVG